MSAWHDRYGKASFHRATGYAVKRDAELQFPQMPKYDTRDLTGRIMGDPDPNDMRLATMRRLKEMEGTA